MSQLTSEEKALYEKATSWPFLADDESSVVPGLIRAIDRLSARVEELEREAGESKVRLCNSDLERLRLAKNLSSLLSAVEHYLAIGGCISGTEKIRAENNLSTVAAGIKGGKG